MDQTPERHQDLTKPGYPTKDEVDKAWLKLVVQPALLEEIRRIQEARSEAAAHIRAAVKAPQAAPARMRREASTGTGPMRRESLWSRLLRLLRRR